MVRSQAAIGARGGRSLAPTRCERTATRRLSGSVAKQSSHSAHPTRARAASRPRGSALACAAPPAPRARRPGCCVSASSRDRAWRGSQRSDAFLPPAVTCPGASRTRRGARSESNSFGREKPPNSGIPVAAWSRYHSHHPGPTRRERHGSLQRRDPRGCRLVPMRLVRLCDRSSRARPGACLSRGAVAVPSNARRCSASHRGRTIVTRSRAHRTGWTRPASPSFARRLPRLRGRRAGADRARSRTVGPASAASRRTCGSTTRRSHAATLVYRDDDSEARILDDRSLNGVFRNGSRVELAELEDGDEIAIGRFTLFFVSLAGSRSPSRTSAAIPCGPAGPSRSSPRSGGSSPRRWRPDRTGRRCHRASGAARRPDAAAPTGRRRARDQQPAPVGRPATSVRRPRAVKRPRAGVGRSSAIGSSPRCRTTTTAAAGRRVDGERLADRPGGSRLEEQPAVAPQHDQHAREQRWQPPAVRRPRELPRCARQVSHPDAAPAVRLAGRDPAASIDVRDHVATAGRQAGDTGATTASRR